MYLFIPNFFFLEHDLFKYLTDKNMLYYKVDDKVFISGDYLVASLDGDDLYDSKDDWFQKKPSAKVTKSEKKVDFVKI